MPKKRKTRTAQTRAQPKVPDGDEGANLELDLKKEKLKTLLQDYETQMTSFYEDIKENLKDFEKSIECAYMVEVAKIPKYIRDMDLDEYQKAGGQLTSTELFGSDKVTQDITMDIENNMSGLATLTKSKRKKKKDVKAMDAVEEETATVKKAAPRGRKKAMSSAATNVMPPPTTSRTRRTTRNKQFETPARWGGPGAAGWETPLITPKFDPRLPVTPAMARRAKDGEVLLSLAGSPISNTDKSMTVKKGKRSMTSTILLNDTEVDLDNIQVPDYTQTTMDYLRKLREKLNAIPLSPSME